MGKCIAAVALCVLTGQARADVLEILHPEPSQPAVQVEAPQPKKKRKSTVAVKLTALELDYGSHDTFTRVGRATFLGTEDGVAVLLVSRYLVDMTYEETERGDAFSDNDWGEHRLSFLSESYVLAPIAQRATSKTATAFYRTNGVDADRALVYIPLADGSALATGKVASLGIEHPTAFLND